MLGAVDIRCYACHAEDGEWYVKSKGKERGGVWANGNRESEGQEGHGSDVAEGGDEDCYDC